MMDQLLNYFQNYKPNGYSIRLNVLLHVPEMQCRLRCDCWGSDGVKSEASETMCGRRGGLPVRRLAAKERANSTVSALFKNVLTGCSTSKDFKYPPCLQLSDFPLHLLTAKRVSCGRRKLYCIYRGKGRTAVIAGENEGRSCCDWWRKELL